MERFCIDCKWFKAAQTEYGEPECLAPLNLAGTVNPVTGKTLPLCRYCCNQRTGFSDEPTRCGPLGRWFEPREEATP